ncbi:MAG: hypothetical protein IKO93_22980 [Lentisphaeria bacterium]|nr:hypothetical protein [Lentisphaeria bacterium]
MKPAAAGSGKKYPQMKIELLNEGWDGRNTSTFLAVPRGGPHNFEENVFVSKPDPVISEFVNDCGLPSESSGSDHLFYKRSIPYMG